VTSKRLSDAVRLSILASLRQGTSVGQTAQAHGIAKSSVSRIARQEGLALERSRTKKASAAAAQYGLERRLALSNKLFATIEGFLDGDLAPQDLQTLVMAFAVTTDKRRLEEGEVTERHAHRDERSAILERGRERLRLLSS